MPTMYQDTPIAGMAYMGKEVCGLAAGGNIAFIPDPILYTLEVSPTTVSVNEPFHITATMNRISVRVVAFDANSGAGLAQGNASVTEQADGTKEYRSTMALGSPGTRTINFWTRDADGNQSEGYLSATVTISATYADGTPWDPAGPPDNALSDPDTPIND